MNLLVFTLAVDAEHVTLAFGLRWLEALAARFEHIDVVTMTRGPHRLPANVRVWSVGRERGYPEWLRVLRFYWLVGKILRRRRIDVVFTHMIPVFAVLFWPVAQLAGLHNVLWYAHGATPWMLKIASRLVDRIVSPTPESFRLHSSKVTFIGHGIDMHVFGSVERRGPTSTLRLISVSRLAPSKGLDILVDALAEWQTSHPWNLVVVGDATSDDEAVYAKTLRDHARSVFGDSRIQFVGRKTPAEIATLFGESDIFLNLSATGSLDKAIIEAMAACCCVISSNDAFRGIAINEGFPEMAITRTPEAIRATLTRVAEMPLEERRELAKRQAAVALRDHTLEGLMVNLSHILYSVARRTA